MPYKSFLQKVCKMQEGNDDNTLMHYINEGIDKELLFNALRKGFILRKNSNIHSDEKTLSINYKRLDIDNSISNLVYLTYELMNYEMSKNMAIEKTLYLIQNFNQLSATEQEEAKFSSLPSSKIHQEIVSELEKQIRKVV